MRDAIGPMRTRMLPNGGPRRRRGRPAGHLSVGITKLAPSRPSGQRVVTVLSLL